MQTLNLGKYEKSPYFVDNTNRTQIQYKNGDVCLGSTHISSTITFICTPGMNAFYTPETKFGGVYRSHPVVGRLVGRAVGPAVRCVFLFQYNFIQ